MSKLTNKSYKDYSYVSRYASFPYYYHIDDNKYIYGITAYLDDTTLYTLHTVRQGDTIDKLAMEYYGNPTLYWIICSYNHIRNPYTKLVEGTAIKIPAMSNIKFDKLGRG